MAQPSDKSPAIEAVLEAHYGRSTAIRADKCIKEPIGCGGPALEFEDDLSRKEYTVSGLCQTCQNKIFDRGEEDEGLDISELVDVLEGAGMTVILIDDPREEGTE